MLSSVDDKQVGEKVRGWLGELSFSRDARSLTLACRTSADGAEVATALDETDELDLQIAALDKEKLAAVAAEDFLTAGELLERVTSLKGQREARMAQGGASAAAAAYDPLDVRHALKHSCTSPPLPPRAERVTLRLAVLVAQNGLMERAVRRTVRPGDAEERAAFAKADEIREFGMLMLEAFILPNAPPDAPLTPMQLRTLCDGPFAKCDCDGFTSDGVDLVGLRSYLDAEEAIRIGGVGGVEMLDVADGAGNSGWELIAWMMSPIWEERPTAEEALKHPFWAAKMFF